MYTNRGGTRGGQEEVGHFPFANNFFSSWGQTIGQMSSQIPLFLSIHGLNTCNVGKLDSEMP